MSNISLTLLERKSKRTILLLFWWIYYHRFTYHSPENKEKLISRGKYITLHLTHFFHWQTIHYFHINFFWSFFCGSKSNYIQISYENSYPSAFVWNPHLMDTVYEIDWVNNSIYFTNENFTNWDNYNWINIIFSYQIFVHFRVAKFFLLV